MLQKVRDLENYVLRASDGEIGKAKDFLFDDEKWTVRYLVADTGSWLSSRKVLISPHAMQPTIEGGLAICVNLTKQQIEAGPSLESHQPISRQFEDEYYSFYGWPYYGNGAYLWGNSPYLAGAGPTGLHAAESYADEREKAAQMGRKGGPSDHSLRSMNEVTGYHIHATDGDLGHIEDFIVDQENWLIRYLVVDTKNWWPGKHVLVSPQWIDRVSWEEAKIFVNVSKAVVLGSPEYTPQALNPDYETRLFANYDNQDYRLNQANEDADPVGNREHEEILNVY
jgi:hypothetical protein